MTRLILLLWEHITHLKNTTTDKLRLYVDTNRHEHEWTTVLKKKLFPNQFLLTPTTLSLWISVLVFNTHVTHHNKFYKQVIGLPMGTNAAVNLANFTLFTYEYDHLILCVLNGKHDTLRHLHYQKRYLDDIFTGNNNNFDDYKDDIYPQDTLTLNLEQEGLP